MRRFSAAMAIITMFASATIGAGAEPFPAINQKHRQEAEFRGPISITVSVAAGEDGSEERSVFATVQAGSQEIVLIANKQQIKKKLDYHSVPRQGDLRSRIAHVKGQLEFRPRTDAYRPSDVGTVPQPHLLVKSLEIYFVSPKNRKVRTCEVYRSFSFRSSWLR